MGWFTKKKPKNGPDYSAITSREEALRLVEQGELVPVKLLPEAFGGDDDPANVVFVTSLSAEMKEWSDETVRRMAEEATVTRYTAEPRYSGKSFVPVAITIRAFDPGDFTEIIGIWGDGLEAPDR